jgi:arylsulfatase A-like enzyme
LIPERKSLVLVTVDCLRADHCGFNGYTRPTTPFLDTLAFESFAPPTAVIAGAPTYYSLPAILASRMPLALGRDVVGVAPGEKTLATALREAGYATAAFSAANPYISPRFGYDQGFETFNDFLDFASLAGPPDVPLASSSSATRSMLNQTLKSAAHAVGAGRVYDDLYFEYCMRLSPSRAGGMDELRRFPSSEAIVDHAIAWLTSNPERPFFIWLHLMDPHSPYYPSPKAFLDFADREADPVRARYVNEFWNRSDLSPSRLQSKKESIVELYDAGIRAVDNQIARFVTHLKGSNRWDNCVFACTADHGEEFLDHDRRYHAPVNLHDEVARVPLIIRTPSVSKTNAQPAPFSHLHLAPTLLDALGVLVPDTFRGTSLWPNMQEGKSRNEAVITECVYGCTNPFRSTDRMAPRLMSVRKGQYKLIMRLVPGSIEELYDLNTDPNEQDPVPSDSNREIRRELLNIARQHIRSTSDSSYRSMPRLKTRLRDLRLELQSTSR